MAWKICLLVVAMAIFVTGGYAQTAEESEEDPTCGLTFAQIPKGLTSAQATARVLEMTRPKGRLGFEMLDGLVWQYSLTEPYDRVAGWLAESKGLKHRLEFLRSLAALGAGRLEEDEARHLETAISEARDTEEWKQVFAVLGRLDGDRFDQLALAQLGRRVAQAQPKGEEGYSERIQRLNQEDLLREQEFRLVAAREEMRKTLAMPREQRLAATADLYAELDGGFSEYLTPWAASRLVRETWASEPAQQTAQHSQRERVEEVASALRQCLKRAESPSLIEDADERLGIKLRLLRALRHIGGDLSTGELAFIETNSGHHIDPLD